MYQNIPRLFEALLFRSGSIPVVPVNVCDRIGPPISMVSKVGHPVTDGWGIGHPGARAGAWWPEGWRMVWHIVRLRPRPLSNIKSLQAVTPQRGA
ncbi:hypothetical protein EVAR_68433_1 [Eumeta japonica]|uniref:Uncharacterized protein n=1 Tax=Eumeta variegata TaxID=151549 RepID=A0A4C2A488_EUMVA|nr:hypothetical protein EVAR_68433_1 [Eumeta japonica]